MTNWSSFAGQTSSRVTTWDFDSARGWLSSKRYHDGQEPSYEYTGAGRLENREWARGTDTTYAYNNAGESSRVDYSDSTADVSYTYDRQGRQTALVSGGMTTTLTDNDANQALSGAYSGGTLNVKCPHA